MMLVPCDDDGYGGDVDDVDDVGGDGDGDDVDDPLSTKVINIMIINIIG